MTKRRPPARRVSNGKRPQIFVIMAMLVRIMGWLPALASFAVTVIMIPLSTLIGKALARLRKAMVKETDGRVKLASEIITGALHVRGPQLTPSPHPKHVIRAPGLLVF